MVILLADMLGTKSKWHESGRHGAEQAFRRFAKILESSLKECGGGEVAAGAVESDGCVFGFKTAAGAVEFGRQLFREAFGSAHSAAEERIWLRGVILPANGSVKFRRRLSFLKDLPQVEKFDLAPEVLEAVAVEKSGFKGMRLLVHNGLATESLSGAFRVRVGKQFLIPFRKLSHSHYPARIASSYKDVLWMACESNKEWEEYRLLMASRLRWASEGEEEFLHAAATQVVFHECAAILSSLEHRATERRRGKAR